MDLKKKTLIWEENNEPPKNYVWVKNGVAYEYNYGTKSWEVSNITLNRNTGGGNDNSIKSYTVNSLDELQNPQEGDIAVIDPEWDIVSLLNGTYYIYPNKEYTIEINPDFTAEENITINNLPYCNLYEITPEQLPEYLPITGKTDRYGLSFYVHSNVWVWYDGVEVPGEEGNTTYGYYSQVSPLKGSPLIVKQRDAVKYYEFTGNTWVDKINGYQRVYREEDGYNEKELNPGDILVKKCARGYSQIPKWSGNTMGDGPFGEDVYLFLRNDSGFFGFANIVIYDQQTDVFLGKVVLNRTSSNGSIEVYNKDNQKVKTFIPVIDAGYQFDLALSASDFGIDVGHNIVIRIEPYYEFQNENEQIPVNGYYNFGIGEDTYFMVIRDSLVEKRLIEIGRAVVDWKDIKDTTIPDALKSLSSNFDANNNYNNAQLKTLQTITINKSADHEGDINGDSYFKIRYVYGIRGYGNDTDYSNGAYLSYYNQSTLNGYFYNTANITDRFFVGAANYSFNDPTETETIEIYVTNDDAWSEETEATWTLYATISAVHEQGNNAYFNITQNNNTSGPYYCGPNQELSFTLGGIKQYQYVQFRVVSPELDSVEQYNKYIKLFDREDRPSYKYVERFGESIYGRAPQSDWNETDTNSMAYIKNKPTSLTKVINIDMWEDNDAYNVESFVNQKAIWDTINNGSIFDTVIATSNEAYRILSKNYIDGNTKLYMPGGTQNKPLILKDYDICCQLADVETRLNAIPKLIFGYQQYTDPSLSDTLASHKDTEETGVTMWVKYYDNDSFNNVYKQIVDSDNYPIKCDIVESSSTNVYQITNIYSDSNDTQINDGITLPSYFDLCYKTFNTIENE